MKNIKQINDWLDSAQPTFTKTDEKTKYNFNNFTLPLKFTSKIYHHDLMLQEAKDDQKELKILINEVNNDFNPKNQTKIKEKDDGFKFAGKLFSMTEEIINAFKKGIFPYVDGFQVEKETDEEIDEESMLENEEIESEESTAQKKNQQGKGLKIITPNQMLSRLPISLARLNAGNNSEKLKNEIRQIFYSLYRSKKLEKRIYII